MFPGSFETRYLFWSDFGHGGDKRSWSTTITETCMQSKVRNVHLKLAVLWPWQLDHRQVPAGQWAIRRINTARILYDRWWIFSIAGPMKMGSFWRERRAKSSSGGLKPGKVCRN